MRVTPFYFLAWQPHICNVLEGTTSVAFFKIKQVLTWKQVTE